jgi:hypothetical protein
MRDEAGRRIRPLGNESINKALGLLVAIIDVAVYHEILASTLPAVDVVGSRPSVRVDVSRRRRGPVVAGCG